MSETNMPAAEAENEVNTYELAFHVLPTVAEGEVTSVVDAIKAHITKAGGTITIEEAPARFELAYEIVKYLEGRNRKFTSAYFGWIRFTLEPEKLAELTAEVENMKDILRAMTIKLTKVEEENPFYFHPSITEKKVDTIEINDSEETEEKTEEASSEEDTSETDTAEDGEETEENV